MTTKCSHKRARWPSFSSPRLVLPFGVPQPAIPSRRHRASARSVPRRALRGSATEIAAMKRLLAVGLLVCGCAAERETERPAEQRIERPGDATSWWVRGAQQVHELADKAIDRYEGGGSPTAHRARRNGSSGLGDGNRCSHHATRPLRQGCSDRPRAGTPGSRAAARGAGTGLPAVAGPFRTQLFIVASNVKAALGDQTGSAEAARAAKLELSGISRCPIV